MPSNRWTMEQRRAQLADCVGQRIVAVDAPDDGSLGLRLESGELVILAELARTPADVVPKLGISWAVLLNQERRLSRLEGIAEAIDRLTA